MATPARPPLTFVAGDDETFVLTITSDAEGVVPVDITGRTYVMSIKADDAATVVASDAGTVVGASGQVTFQFAAAVTETFAIVPHTYDVVETASGAESTLILGPLKVLAGVTA
jgi:hypothetical protein